MVSNLGLRNPSTISIRNAFGWTSWIALIVADHRFRESSSPMLFPPIDQGWHGGPATRRSASRNTERSVRSSLSWMILLNPLSLSVATHLSLASTRVRWWNPSDLAAWAKPPHPENRSTTVLWVRAAPSCLFKCMSFTPSKLTCAGLTTPSFGLLSVVGVS